MVSLLKIFFLTGCSVLIISKFIFFFFFILFAKKNYNKKGLNGRCKFAINSPFEYKIPTLSSVKILNKNNVLQTYYTKVIKLGLMTLMVTSLVTPKLVINCKILQTAVHKCSIKFVEESFQDFFFINCKL